MSEEHSGLRHSSSLGGKLISFSGLISAVAISAFVLSCAYIAGFQTSARIEVISHFLPQDYIVMAPEWLVPGSGALLAILFVTVVIAPFLLNSPRVKLSVPETNRESAEPEETILEEGMFEIPWRWALRIALALCIVGMLAAAYMWWFWLKTPRKLNMEELFSWDALIALAAFGFLPLGAFALYLWFGQLVRHDFVGMQTHFVVTKQNLWFLCASVGLTFLLFVYGLGYWYAPKQLERSPTLEATVQTTAFTTQRLRGKLLFVLSHVTLLVDGENVIAVPNEKLLFLKTAEPEKQDGHEKRLVPGTLKGPTPTAAQKTASRHVAVPGDPPVLWIWSPSGRRPSPLLPIFPAEQREWRLSR